MSNNRPFKKNPHNTHLKDFASRVLSDRKKFKSHVKNASKPSKQGAGQKHRGQRPISQDVLVVFHRLQFPC